MITVRKGHERLWHLIKAMIFLNLTTDGSFNLLLEIFKAHMKTRPVNTKKKIPMSFIAQMQNRAVDKR